MYYLRAVYFLYLLYKYIHLHTTILDHEVKLLLCSVPEDCNVLCFDMLELIYLCKLTHCYDYTKFLKMFIVKWEHLLQNQNTQLQNYFSSFQVQKSKVIIHIWLISHNQGWFTKKASCHHLLITFLRILVSDSETPLQLNQGEFLSVNNILLLWSACSCCFISTAAIHLCKEL